MNPKVMKARRDVDRVERKLAELAAELKELKATRAKLEDADIVKRIRSASEKSGMDIDGILELLESGAEPSIQAPAGEEGSEVD